MIYHNLGNGNLFNVSKPETIRTFLLNSPEKQHTSMDAQKAYAKRLVSMMRKMKNKGRIIINTSSEIFISELCSYYENIKINEYNFTETKITHKRVLK